MNAAGLNDVHKHRLYPAEPSDPPSSALPLIRLDSIAIVSPGDTTPCLDRRRRQTTTAQTAAAPLPAPIRAAVTDGPTDRRRQVHLHLASSPSPALLLSTSAASPRLTASGPWHHGENAKHDWELLVLSRRGCGGCEGRSSVSHLVRSRSRRATRAAARHLSRGLRADPHLRGRGGDRRGWAFF